MSMIFMKYRDKSNEFDTMDVKATTVSHTLPEILSDFAHFLKACGYNLPNTEYPIIVNEEERDDT